MKPLEPMTTKPQMNVGIDYYQASLPVHMDVDLLDPESMMAFFSQQMSNLRTNLGTAMRDQAERNRRSGDLQHLEAQLTKYQEQGINPGSPQWNEFLELAKQVKATCGEGSAAARAIDRALTVMPPKTGDETLKQIAEARGATVQKIGPGEWLISNEHYGLDKNGVQSLVNEIKACRDTIQQDNQVNMINIQRLVEQSSQVTQMCSNIMKKLSDMSMAAINNMR